MMTQRVNESDCVWAPVAGEVMDPDAIPAPRFWGTPRRVLIGPMGDLLGPKITDLYIKRVFNAMGRYERHRFVVQTDHRLRAQNIFRFGYPKNVTVKDTQPIPRPRNPRNPRPVNNPEVAR